MTQTKHILIVDDDPDFRTLLATGLQAHGDYTVETAATFEQGLQAVRLQKHDIYLVDYQLDNGHFGTELLEVATGKLCSRILMTSDKDASIGDRAIRNGACDFLHKRHITIDLLDRVIRNSLERLLRINRIMTRQVELAQQLSRDPLTGLVSRAVLQQQVETRLRSELGRGILIYLDLDDFKPVNDRYGHAIGDLLLQEVATRLIGCVHPTDIVGRLGGDEFLIFLPVTDQQVSLHTVAVNTANKLITRVARPYYPGLKLRSGGNSIRVSASLGLALAPVDATDYNDLVNLADRAMHRAKNNGRNKYCFHLNNNLAPGYASIS